MEIMQVTKQNFLPVTTVADETQIRQRTFWRANFFFYFRKQIACKGKKSCLSFLNYFILAVTLLSTSRDGV